MQRITINAERLWADLLELGRIGGLPNGGVTRPALSAEDQQARLWLIDKMTEAGLEVRVDGIMNVIGTLKSGHPERKKMALGSHLDTVPEGGRFDGAYGVIAALECARSLRESGVDLPCDLEVISFCDEEAAHNAGTVGSRAMMGQLKEGELCKAKNEGAEPFIQHLLKLGQDPNQIASARRDPAELAAFLELHIEQGQRLESEQLHIGVVTAIVGVYRYIVTVSGEAAHAGTTPMALRKDALVEAAPVFTLLPQWLAEQNPEMVGTIGQVTVAPGASNVVPGQCRFLVELRSQQPEDMQRVRDRLLAYAAERQGWSIETIYEKDSVRLAPELIEQIAAAADQEQLPATLMPSGAGHDAQSLAPFVPTGMIFIPCRNGVSHNPAEEITPAAAAEGCQVLLTSLLRIVAAQTEG